MPQDRPLALSAMPASKGPGGWDSETGGWGGPGRGVELPQRLTVQGDHQVVKQQQEQEALGAPRHLRGSQLAA